MGRKILLVTTDQQRYDSLGCNGGQVARTPTVDLLATTGINYRRAHDQNVVCMPARSTIITGQHPRTHGVYANGVPLPLDAPSIAGYLHERGGYRTALIGKAHFQPNMDPDLRWFENVMATEGSTGPHRGFDHLELALHGYWGRYHYDRWLEANHPEWISGFISFGSGAREGDTGAIDTKYNPMPRELYHTDWVAERTIAWLDALDDADDWFVWMSFPDPHGPWDPPGDEARRRVDWRTLDLPVGHPGSREKAVEILAAKPHHWLDIYEGRLPFMEGPPHVPCEVTNDQVREVNALIHVENELIDEAVGRVLRRIDERGWGVDTDVFFTTDHGELQGDFGFLFKGPYHVEALVHIPLVWRPAPGAGVSPAEVDEPVGQLDLAPTFCEIAGLPVPDWVQGAPLPLAGGSGRERVITEWESQFEVTDIRMRTLYRDGWVCTAYAPSRLYEGTEGELYDLADDPLQWHNRWDDPTCAALRSDLVADLYDHLPPEREPRLEVEATF